MDKPNQTEQNLEQPKVPMVRLVGLSVDSHEYIMVEQAKKNARSHRDYTKDEMAGLLFNQFVEENK